MSSSAQSLSAFVVDWGPLFALLCGLVTITRIWFIAGRIEKSVEIHTRRLDKHSGAIEAMTVTVARLDALPQQMMDRDARMRDEVSNLRGRVDQIYDILAGDR